MNGLTPANPAIALTKSRRRIAFSKARDYADYTENMITARICGGWNGDSKVVGGPLYDL
jgi:hypothetical protein